MNEPQQFRKKPVVIDAVQYHPHVNCAAVAAFLGYEHSESDCAAAGGDINWLIPTLEGTMEASPGDWIIRGVQGEFYPCKPNIFTATYEPVQQKEEQA